MLQNAYMICLRVPPELLLPACPPAYACWFSPIQMNRCLYPEDSCPGIPGCMEGASGDHQADRLHNVCMYLQQRIQKTPHYSTVKTKIIRNMTNTAGEGCET